jgi:predicted Zn-dependent protease
MPRQRCTSPLVLLSACRALLHAVCQAARHACWATACDGCRHIVPPPSMPLLCEAHAHAPGAWLHSCSKPFQLCCTCMAAADVPCPALLPPQLLCKLEWQQQDGAAAAAATFECAQEACGPTPQLLNAWAQLQLQQQDIKAARQLLEQARVLDPSHQHSLQSQAQMEHRAGAAAKSAALYTAAEANEPDSAPTLHARAVYLRKRGSLQEAEECLQRLQALEPDNGYLCHTRGLQALEQGELDVARSWFRRGAGHPDEEQSLLNYEVGALGVWRWGSGAGGLVLGVCVCVWGGVIEQKRLQAQAVQ